MKLILYCEPLNVGDIRKSYVPLKAFGSDLEKESAQKEVSLRDRKLEIGKIKNRYSAFLDAFFDRFMKPRDVLFSYSGFEEPL